MAQHATFTIDTGVKIYSCDPASPWQRGSNENTNGLLRQYFPNRTSLKLHSQDQPDEDAAELNGRPLKTLEFMTPSQKLPRPSRRSPESADVLPWALAGQRVDYRGGQPRAATQGMAAARLTPTCLGPLPLLYLGRTWFRRTS